MCLLLHLGLLWETSLYNSYPFLLITVMQIWCWVDYCPSKNTSISSEWGWFGWQQQQSARNHLNTCDWERWKVDNFTRRRRGGRSYWDHLRKINYCFAGCPPRSLWDSPAKRFLTVSRSNHSSVQPADTSKQLRTSTTHFFLTLAVQCEQLKVSAPPSLCLS